MKKLSGAETLTLLAYIFVVLMPLSTVLHAFVLTKLWLWFVVTTFGVPALTIPAAAGLSVAMSMFRGVPAKKGDEEGDGLFEQIFKLTFMVISHPMMALLFGSIIKAFS